MRHIPSALIACLLVLLVGGSPTEAREEGPSVIVQVEGKADILATGDARIELVMAFPEAAYANVKQENPNPRKFLRDFAGHRADAEYSEASAVFDDTRHSVILRLLQRGGMQTLGHGRWVLQLEAGIKYEKTIEVDGRQIVVLRQQGLWAPDVGYIGSLQYRMPAGATNVAYDQNRNRLTYTLQRPDGTGPAILDTELRVKQRLMSAIYKAYGLGKSFGGQWVGKMVFRNGGQSVMRDLKVRFRVPGYSEWSLWQKFKEVVPGQTAVATYYPVFEEKIARLSSNTPADVRVEWKYKDATGAEHEDSDGQRITVLGVHEFVFTDIMRGENFGTWHEQFANASLLAAWVSRDDAAVKQFASMANKNAGGVGATQSVENAVTVLKAIYELMRKNNITYQYPPTLRDHSVSFDPQQVQNVKFPRDVLRDRSGTCIDLAILYAAAANNLGIRSYLALVPGHVFPIFQLPNGRMIGVESTGVGGGLRFGSAPFDKMLQMGMWEQDKWSKDGRYFLIDVRDLWSKGISNPELPELPADILERWGINTGDKVTPTDVPPGRPLAPGLPPGFQIPGSGQTQQSSPVEGMWLGKVTERSPAGGTFEYPMLVRITPTGDGGYQVESLVKAEVPQQNGAPLKVEVQQVYLGKIQGGKLRAQGQNKTLIVNGERREGTLDQFEAGVEGGNLVGQFGNQKDGASPFSLPRHTPQGEQPSQPAPSNAASPFNGKWLGMLEETLQNGNKLRYPLMITIEQQQDGSFVIVGRLRAEATGANGQKVVLEAEELWLGRLDGKVLRGEGKKKIMKVNGQQQETVLDSIEMTIDRGLLVGRFGNETDGVTNFTIERHKEEAGPSDRPRGSVTPRPGTTPTTARAAVEGMWEGTVTDRMPDGSSLTYPLQIKIVRQQNGGFRVELYAEITVQGNQGPVKMQVAQEGTGRLNGNTLSMQGTRKVMRVNGEDKEVPVDSGTMKVAGGMLVGKAGNQQNGYTQFRLRRSK